MPRVLPYIAAFACAVAVFLTSCLACAEEPLEEVLDMDGAISLPEGDEAPFDGILLPITLAIELGFNIETLETRLIIDIEREREVCRAHLAFEERRRELEEERRDFQIELLQQRLQQQAEQLAQPTPWYRRWGFAYGMGIVSSIILVAGGVAAVIGVM